MERGPQKSLFEKCTCSTHCFEIERFCYEPVLDEGFNLFFWRFGYCSHILSWSERLKWIWNIIRTGKVQGDDIVISNEQAKEIAGYINKHLQKE